MPLLFLLVRVSEKLMWQFLLIIPGNPEFRSRKQVLVQRGACNHTSLKLPSYGSLSHVGSMRSLSVCVCVCIIQTA